ncbi:MULTISPECIES: tripartite tricarboxylate transporter substrate-binding protein [unclassified Polynucleobacter]|uniref:tripartite tricarboxylate transporter substrate-binding protein n=1 Tax=unclassified Polynucleobacter TaxID=2640945 RepID=UPI0008B87756|nr:MULTISPECIES: tripartite tricarboxylate transporter substrate-binding protein [unclassified Polynucleobacter]OHC10297.1 MAG: hypothetical protein A2X74_00150 [Polynucleobacter sp. GWA2_45_21]HBK44124.1 hypothetical protein [Polynucleobacter sp.]
MKLLTKVLIAVGIASSTPFALADYPDRPITIVVPFAAGGPSDKIARDLAEALRKPLKETIVVDNTGGAGGTIGAAKVANAKPDGYTLLVHHIGMATAPALYRKLSYKVPDDFEFLGLVNEAPSTLITKPTVDAKNFAELRKYIESSGGKLNMANAGIGSASHLCGLMIQQALKADLTTVPYKGTAPAMADLMAGQVDIMCEQATNSVPQIEGGKVKVFGVTSTKRATIPALKNVPTLSESGLKDFNVQVWHGLYAPKGTPPEIIAKLNSALKVALKDPEFIKREEALGISVIKDDRNTPTGHKKFVEAEVDRWGKVIQSAGAYAD